MPRKHQFKAGDRVIVNYGLVATLETYQTPDEGNIVVYVSHEGGGVNRTTAHTSHTHLEYLDAGVETGEEAASKADVPATKLTKAQQAALDKELALLTAEAQAQLPDEAKPQVKK